MPRPSYCHSQVVAASASAFLRGRFGPLRRSGGHARLAGFAWMGGTLTKRYCNVNSVSLINFWGGAIARLPE